MGNGRGNAPFYARYGIKFGMNAQHLPDKIYRVRQQGFNSLSKYFSRSVAPLPKCLGRNRPKRVTFQPCGRLPSPPRRHSPPSCLPTTRQRLRRPHTRMTFSFHSGLASTLAAYFDLVSRLDRDVESPLRAMQARGPFNRAESETAPVNGIITATPIYYFPCQRLFYETPQTHVALLLESHSGTSDFNTSPSIFTRVFLWRSTAAVGEIVACHRAK